MYTFHVTVVWLGGNKRMDIQECIIIRPDFVYLLSESLLTQSGIDVHRYLKNTTDGLSLKSSLLTVLKCRHYRYMFPISINMFREECENRRCADMVYEHVCRNVN
jgi:hypothetical protein